MESVSSQTGSIHGTRPGASASSCEVHALRDQEGKVFAIPEMEEKFSIGQADSCDLRISDPFVSRRHCLIARKGRSLFVIDKHSKNGTYLDGTRIRDAEVRLGSKLTIGGTTLTAVGSKKEENVTARKAIVGTSPALLSAIDMAYRAAATSCSVLILGETGTGKELFAELIHESSHRRNGPFVALNCGAIPAELIGSELFGHKRGSFTGAVSDKKGLFASAEAGTLFLDEIGELPIEQQPHLLRALETKSFRQIGGTEEEPFNVRLVAATNRLDAGQVGAALRTDLYHRLATVVIELPPLRDRRQDIPHLVRAFIRQLEPEFGPRSIDYNALLGMCDYSWPGNVRELRQAVQRAVALCPQKLELDVLLPKPLASSKGSSEPTHGQATISPESISDDSPLYVDIVKHALEQAYRKHGSIRRAAASLGIPKSTFADRAKRLGIRTRRGIDWDNHDHRKLKQG